MLILLAGFANGLPNRSEETVGGTLFIVSLTELRDVRGELDAHASRLRCSAIPSSLAGDDHENTLSSLVTPDRVRSVSYREV